MITNQFALRKDRIQLYHDQPWLGPYAPISEEETAGVRRRTDVEIPESGQAPGRHRACPYGGGAGCEHRSGSEQFQLSTTVGHAKGGVAGGIPPHKGGPKARPPKGEE